MRLTTKGRYAVTAMLDLAMHKNDGPICLSDISERQSISLSYLEQLFSRLRKNELVESVRGPGGGYTLAQPVEQIFVSEIINAVDESIDATHCGGQGDCNNGVMCITHDLWEDLSAQIHEFLCHISLASLVDKRCAERVDGSEPIEDRVLELRTADI